MLGKSNRHTDQTSSNLGVSLTTMNGKSGWQIVAAGILLDHFSDSKVILSNSSCLYMM